MIADLHVSKHLDCRQKLRHFSISIVPPVRGPDSVKLPAKTFENSLAELVTITRCRCTMISRAIAFHAEQVTTASFWIDDAQIHPIAGTANLVLDLVTCR